MEELCDDIARKIKQGEKTRQKAAVFHTQVLLHADKLENVEAVSFCLRVGVSGSYSVEFHKIRNSAIGLRKSSAFSKPPVLGVFRSAGKSATCNTKSAFVDSDK